MVKDEDVKTYINDFKAELEIRNLEDEILRVMKFRNEEYSNEKNDKEWLEFTNFVLRRRCKQWSK